MSDDRDDFDYQVPGVVPVVTQQGPTCWAAATTMMKSWHKQQTLSTEAAIAETGEPFVTYLRKGRALPHSEFPPFAFAAGMQLAPLRSYTPRQLMHLMIRRRSPLMICVFWPNNTEMTHMYVLFRISGNGANVDNVLVEYNDPLTGHEEMGFKDFMEQMEAASDRRGINGQLLHY